MAFDDGVEWATKRCGDLASIGAVVLEKRADKMTGTKRPAVLLDQYDTKLIQLSTEYRVAFSPEAERIEEDSDDDELY